MSKGRVSTAFEQRWPAPRPRGSHRALAFGAMLLFGVLYWVTAARTIQGGDVGEFLVVVHRGGVAHPPGYPLYVLLGKAFTSLPILNPILRLSLVSIVCAVAALGVLYAALTRWGLSRTSAALGAAVLGVNPLFWRYACVPEVFALGTLLAASLLWVSSPLGRPRGSARAFAVGLIFGLGLANHHTIILLAPVGLLGLWRSTREGAVLRSCLTAPLGLVLGLAPYLTLLGSNGVWAWGGEMDLAGVFDHFLRMSYGTFSLGLNQQGPGFLENVWAYASTLPYRFNLFLPIGVLGIGVATWLCLSHTNTWFHRLRRRILGGANIQASAPNRTEQVVSEAISSHSAPPVLEAMALLASFLLTAVGFLMLFNLRPEGLAASVLERFYILPDLLLAVFVAVGLEVLLSARKTFAPYMRTLPVGLLCLMGTVFVNDATWSDDFVVEDYLFNALDSVAPGGVIVGTGDIGVYGFLAAKEVYAYRTDVTYIDLNLIRTRWYYDRVVDRLPELEVPFNSQTTPVIELLANLTDEHTVYLADVPNHPGLTQVQYPWGVLMSIVPPGHRIPSAYLVERWNQTLFGRMRFRGLPESDETRWGYYVQSFYTRPWLLLAKVYGQMGEQERADAMAEQADNFAQMMLR